MATLAILTAFYPAVFAFVPSTRGVFTTKPDALLDSVWYVPLFMLHIGFGAVAIMAGSTQFFDRIRIKKPKVHRTLGKIYVAAVIPSGIAGFIVGFYATGEWYSKFGFISLAVGWLLCTVVAYLKIRQGNFDQHRRWMMRSFAFCFAFVTFRIYLGIASALGIPFYDFYSYLSLLSWVPNWIFIEWKIKQLKSYATA